MAPKFFISKDDAGLFFWTLESQGRVIAQSGTCYSRKASCEKSIISVMTGAPLAAVFDLVNGEFEWDPPRDRVGSETRQWIFEADGGSCYLCNEPVDPSDWHLDHVVPRSQGGPTSIDNLRVTHPRCNSTKGTRIVVDLGPTDPWRRGPWPAS